MQEAGVNLGGNHKEESPDMEHTVDSQKSRRRSRGKDGRIVATTILCHGAMTDCSQEDPTTHGDNSEFSDGAFSDMDMFAYEYIEAARRDSTEIPHNVAGQSRKTDGRIGMFKELS